ncbi:hypothetical protein ACG7TL_007102 [Trametes sanguinea]
MQFVQKFLVALSCLVLAVSALPAENARRAEDCAAIGGQPDDCF